MDVVFYTSPHSPCASTPLRSGGPSDFVGWVSLALRAMFNSRAMLGRRETVYRGDERIVFKRTDADGDSFRVPETVSRVVGRL